MYGLYSYREFGSVLVPDICRVTVSILTELLSFFRFSSCHSILWIHQKKQMPQCGPTSLSLGF